MCTPKKLLHRQEALIHAIKQDQPMKIKTPAHHQCCNDARREAHEIVEEMCSHDPKVDVDEDMVTIDSSYPEDQAKA